MQDIAHIRTTCIGSQQAQTPQDCTFAADVSIQAQQSLRSFTKGAVAWFVSICTCTNNSIYFQRWDMQLSL